MILLSKKQHYKKKFEEEYKSLYRSRKGNTRKWWRVFYYLSLKDGDTPNRAYKTATSMINDGDHYKMEKIHDDSFKHDALRKIKQKKKRK